MDLRRPADKGICLGRNIGLGKTSADKKSFSFVGHGRHQRKRIYNVENFGHKLAGMCPFDSTDRLLNFRPWHRQHKSVQQRIVLAFFQQTLGGKD